MDNIKSSITAFDEKLQFKEKFGYGFGDFAFNFVYQGVSLYLVIFYTDVVGIAPLAISLMFAIVRVFDAVTDPLIGSIVDLVDTKHGRFRPFLLWFAIPFGVSLVLVFTAPGLVGGGMLIYAYVTYIALGIFCSFLMCPYASLAAAMTQDSKERGELGAIRIIGGQGAALIVGSLIPIMLLTFQDTYVGAAGAYQVSMAICAVIGTIAYFICFKVTKERYVQIGVKVKYTKDIIVKMIFTNKPFITLWLMIFFMHGFFAVSAAGLAFYYTYIFEDLQGLAVLNMVSAAATIVGLLIVLKLLDRYDKKKIALVGSIGCLIMPLYFQFCPPTAAAMWIAVAVRVVYGLFWAAIQGLVWGLVPDTIEYAELRSGKRAEGLMTALQSFSYKAGMACAGVIPGIVLAVTGFVPLVAQTDRALAGIRLMNGWIPFVLMLATVICMAVYPLTRDKYEDVLKQLREQKQTQSAE